MTEPKRAKKKHRKTAIVPRVVFQTVVAMSVVPAAGAAASGCGGGVGPAVDAGYRVDSGFSVAMPRDSGFGVAVDATRPDAGFGVADVGPPPHDAGADSPMFSVAMPIDSGLFGVAAEPDAGLFGVAMMAVDEDAG